MYMKNKFNSKIISLGVIALVTLGLTACGKPPVVKCEDSYAYIDSTIKVVDYLSKKEPQSVRLIAKELGSQKPGTEGFDNRVCGMDAKALVSYYNNPIKNQINDVKNQLQESLNQVNERNQKALEE